MLPTIEHWTLTGYIFLQGLALLGLSIVTLALIVKAYRREDDFSYPPIGGEQDEIIKDVTRQLDDATSIITRETDRHDAMSKTITLRPLPLIELKPIKNVENAREIYLENLDTVMKKVIEWEKWGDLIESVHEDEEGRMKNEGLSG